MSTGANAVTAAKHPVKRKSGSHELDSLMLRQRSAKRHEALA
jgi:hypothetical protein